MAKAKFVWHGDEAKRVAREAAMAALRDGAEAILTESQKEVPHDTGALSRSGTVIAGNVLGKLEAYIVYNTPYARYQHETPGLHHEPGRKWKYLEDPFKKLAPKALKYVRLAVRAALKGRR